MELTHTIMKYDTPDGVAHEIDFKDNQDKMIQILRANYNKETITVQIKVQDKVLNLLSSQLYF